MRDYIAKPYIKPVVKLRYTTVVIHHG